MLSWFLFEANHFTINIAKGKQPGISMGFIVAKWETMSISLPSFLLHHDIGASCMPMCHLVSQHSLWEKNVCNNYFIFGPKGRKKKKSCPQWTYRHSTMRAVSKIQYGTEIADTPYYIGNVSDTIRVSCNCVLRHTKSVTCPWLESGYHCTRSGTGLIFPGSRSGLCNWYTVMFNGLNSSSQWRLFLMPRPDQDSLCVGYR